VALGKHLERINAQRHCTRIDVARHLHVIADVAFRGGLIGNNQDSFPIRHDQNNLSALRHALPGVVEHGMPPKTITCPRAKSAAH
jgi:hypothetical protein